MNRKRVLVLADLPGEGLSRLAKHCDVTTRPEGVASERELAWLVGEFHGLLTPLTQRVGAEEFAAGERLEIVANCAVGVDNIDLEAAGRSGVVVTNTPDVLTEDTADLAFALILAVLRGLVDADRFLRSGAFEGWRPKLLLGRSLRGATLGVIGAGRIGQAVLERARAFRMRTIYTKRERLAANRERELGTEWRSFEGLLAEADVISLHAALDETTYHLVDEAALRAMRSGSFLINTARGPLVDERALAEVLADGHLAGAGLDVYEREPEIEPRLLTLENVVLLPHIGSATWETRIRMADCCFDDLITLLVDGQVPPRAVVGGHRRREPAEGQ